MKIGSLSLALQYQFQLQNIKTKMVKFILQIHGAVHTHSYGSFQEICIKYDSQFCDFGFVILSILKYTPPDSSWPAM